jgi:hypothetical protein
MATFVHIADARDSAAIRRVGLRLPKARLANAPAPAQAARYGIFALPVVEDFLLSHQWVRELARRGHRSAVGVYIRLPDNEPVYAGVYNGPKEQITAAQAAAALRSKRILGYEVVIPRAILPAEVVSIRPVPPVGWRYFPEAKGNAPRCLCKFCVRGEAKSRRLRDRLDPEGAYA